MLIIAAMKDEDYTGIDASPLTFAAGSNDNDSRCVNISVADDTTLEMSETFTVTLATSDPDVMLGNNMTTITITDNDCKLHQC